MRFKLFRFIARFISLSTFRRILEFLKHYIGGLLHRIDEHHLFLSGGGIAFSLLLSVIPFVLLVFSILGNIIDVATLENQITRLIDTVIPYPEYASYSKRVILSRLPEVVEYKTLAGYLGVFGLLFTSTWLFSGMRTILNRIFGVSVEKSAWIGILRDFGMVLLLVIFIALSTFILPTLNFLVTAADEIDFFKAFKISNFLDTILSIASIVIIFFLFFAFYYLIPYEKLGKRVPVVAAFWATLLWEIAKRIFGYYVSDFLTINKIYGAFILIAVILFWIFYSSCLFVLGAEIGQLFRERWKIKMNNGVK